ncbi:MAG: D-tyrosyl-tRNA(Tyr) deacylase [Chthonomonadales bacterium]|nr:D-tyrosyl-tRNA(Tyr) deacylase [Chthonomonadales bacterium]
MRAVLQRVTEASVSVGGEMVGSIGPGALVLLGVGDEDTQRDADYVADKVVNLRVFPDADGKMNRSLLDCGGAALIVSQFTLYGDVRKGRRPSFAGAAAPPRATELYEAACERVAAAGVPVARGSFGAMMRVALVNDGPVTLLLDSRRAF